VGVERSGRSAITHRLLVKGVYINNSDTILKQIIQKHEIIKGI
jgi:hypothetical protein